MLTIFKCKYNVNKKVSIPKIFSETYPNFKYSVVTPENFWQILTQDK